jgi:hypothetical protein
VADQVRADVTYDDVTVRWRARAWLVESTNEQEATDGDEQ